MVGSKSRSPLHPPTDANDALIAFIAERLHIPRSQVELISGATSRSKTLRIARKSAAEIQAALSAFG
jgi:uncharacterized protein